MTDLRHGSVLVACLVAACGSPGYGAPTGSTTIELQQSGGFGGPAFGRGVRIVGTTATYTLASTTAQATLDSSKVAAIIGALEDIGFLDLQADYTTCTPVIADAETVTISATLTAGSHTLHHYLGCMGGMFDELTALDRKIYDLSGYDAWVAGR